LRKVRNNLLNYRMADSGRPGYGYMQPGHCTSALLVVVFMWMIPAGAEEQLEQKTIVIKGNQGLPRTLYIAPWKRVGAPLESRMLEGEITEEYEPLERDLFQNGLELRRQGYSIDTSSPPRTLTGPAAASGNAH
jgi:hypothetical protein